MLFTNLRIKIKRLCKRNDLTKQEQVKQIALATIESLFNCYKYVLTLPLTMMGLCASVCGMAMNVCVDVLDCVSTMLVNVQEYIITHLPTVDITHNKKD